jgi:hypothetical protein
MDNKILYTAKFTHHDLKFHNVWWKSDKRCGSWGGGGGVIKKKYHTVGTVIKSKRKIVKRCKMATPNIYIYMTAYFPDWVQELQ